ncbi:PAS domain S-box protein [bacterium]|nr:PAS domain S-box protein [bacterium]
MIKSPYVFFRQFTVLILISQIFLGFLIINIFAEESVLRSVKDLSPDYRKEIVNKADTEIEFKREILSNFVQQIEDKVRTLANNDFTLRYAAQNNAENRKNLTQLFFIVASGNGGFMQVRFLDAGGWEKVRVDRPQGQDIPIVIEGKSLQNKGKRDYFLSIKETPAGQLWRSRFDLNIENGEIEQPLNPTFRIGSPVYLNNSFKGIVIINLRLEPVLKLLRNSTDFDIYLVDQDGRYIIHPDRKKEWSRYFPERGQILDAFPDAGSQILRQENYKNSLFSYSLNRDLQNSEHLKIIFVPKREKDFLLSESIREWLKKNPELSLGILFVILLAGVTLGVILYWNRKLVREIVEKKVVEKRLLENERKTRAVSEAIHDGLIMIDDKATIMYWNRSAERLFGMSADEVMGQDMHSFLVPEKYHNQTKSGLKNFAKTGQGPVVGKLQELTALGKDGIPFPVEVGVSAFQVGENWYAVGTIRDITERKRIEDKLRESEDRVTTVLNSINTGIIIINPQSRTIVDTNPVAAKMIGLSAEDITGKTCHQFICPRKYKECPIIDLEKKVDNTEGVLVTGDGKQIPILKTVVPVMLGGEKHLLESFVDLTGRKVVEEELKNKMVELERFNQLTIDREERMIELKEEINQLCVQMGNSPKYKIVG